MAIATDLLRRDTRANQPAAAAVGAGTLYCVTDEGNLVEQSDGASWSAYSPGGSALTPLNGTVNGRLTTETGVPVSTSDRASQSTIFFTPYQGNRIALYDGSAAWEVLSFSELSLALSGLTSDKNYDVFVDYNAGTPQLVLSNAWTNATTRADALTLQDGVYVLSGATDHRYVGTIHTSGTTTTEDTLSKRFVWNLYNRTLRAMRAIDAANSWTYTTATYRQANANAANQVEYVVGLSLDIIVANIHVMASVSSSTNPSVGVGLDSTTVNSAITFGSGIITGQFGNVPAFYRGFPGIGYHAVVWLEKGNAVGTITWYGDNGGTLVQGGLTAELFN